MSTVLYAPAHRGDTGPGWPIEQNRGAYAIYTVIATEALLFVSLFASYYYLGNNKNRWAVDSPPKVHYALMMLAVLLSSSAVLYWGEKQVKLARYRAARAAIFLTVLIGLAFLVLQVFEFRDHLKTLTPWSDSYGSIFYTITTIHAAHVCTGILLLAYTGILPRLGPSLAPPHRPYHAVALYWHFVDLVWIFIVALLYIVPNLQAG